MVRASWFNQNFSEGEFLGMVMNGAITLPATAVPEDIAWLMKYLFETVLDGRNAYVSDGVQRALDREPKGFAAYARSIAASGLWKIAA